MSNHSINFLCFGKMLVIDDENSPLTAYLKTQVMKRVRMNVEIPDADVLLRVSKKLNSSAVEFADNEKPFFTFKPDEEVIF
jgi:hypothetical protein